MESKNEEHSSNNTGSKETRRKITMLTAYDYSMAKLIDESGINMILVGDSLGMVMLGYEDTLSVTMEDMIHHTKSSYKRSKKCIDSCGYAVYVLSGICL